MCKEMERLAQCHTGPSCGLRQPWSVLSPTLTLYLSASPGPSGEKGEEDEPSPLGFLLQDPEEATQTCLLVLYLFPHHTSHTYTHARACTRAHIHSPATHTSAHSSRVGWGTVSLGFAAATALLRKLGAC